MHSSRSVIASLTRGELSHIKGASWGRARCWRDNTPTPQQQHRVQCSTVGWLPAIVSCNLQPGLLGMHVIRHMSSWWWGKYPSHTDRAMLWISVTELVLCDSCKYIDAPHMACAKTIITWWCITVWKLKRHMCTWRAVTERHSDHAHTSTCGKSNLESFQTVLSYSVSAGQWFRQFSEREAARDKASITSCNQCQCIQSVVANWFWARQRTWSPSFYYTMFAPSQRQAHLCRPEPCDKEARWHELADYFPSPEVMKEKGTCCYDQFSSHPFRHQQYSYAKHWRTAPCAKCAALQQPGNSELEPTHARDIFSAWWG